MTPLRAPTFQYPDNVSSEWAIRTLVQPHVGPSRLYEFAYEVYANQRSLDLGDKPFLINSHKAMVRETHQRIKLTPTGEYTHVSGLTVKPEDVMEFLATDPRANPTGLDPFMFPTYWGKPEALDPQWLREIFLVPQAGQVDALIALYLKGAEARRLSGDHRGTTLDLQVGASSDDAQERDSDGDTWITGHVVEIKSNSLNTARRWFGARWVDSSTSQGDTIDVAYIEVYINVAAALDDVKGDLHFEDATSPVSFSGGADLYDISGRTRTGATALWSATNLGTGWVQSPSVVSPLQEVIDARSPTAFVLIAKPYSDVIRVMRLDTFDADSALAAKLHIEFTAGGGPTTQAVGDGSMTPSGALVKKTSTAPGGATITPAGALGSVLRFPQNVGGGSIASASTLGAAVTFFATVGGGSVAIAGSLVKKTLKAVGDASMAISAVLGAVKVGVGGSRAGVWMSVILRRR